MDDGDDAWLRAICHSTEMGRAIEAFDWGATSLGPPATWPEGLRAAVSICLTTNFPALVVWGPDLVKIYNDGYRPMLGRKHPAALGAPAHRVWPEIWDVVGEMFDSVMITGRPTWAKDQELILDRHGYLEECFFTYSYSPLFDDGEIKGVLDLVFETTEQVVAERRLGCLSTLNAALARAEQVTDVCVAATEAIAKCSEDVIFTDLFLQVGEDCVLVASNRRDDTTPADRIDLAAVVQGKEMVVGQSGDEHMPAALVALPIGGAFGGVQGALVASLNPRRPFDDDLRRFVHVIAETISSALDGAYRRSLEIGEYRRISDTLQAAMLPPSSDLPTIAARYLPAMGNLAVGGDWYDVIDLDEDRRSLIVGDCVGHGLDAATVMAQLRSAARAMVLEGRGPAAVLEGLDSFAAHLDGALCTTVVCTTYDRAARQLTYARAGHPPPLIAGPRGFRWLDGANGPPLAVATDVSRTELTHRVEDDEILVLYSDGLVERRNEHIDLGLARLVESAARQHEHRAQAIADGVLRDLLPENARDDVVLVVKRFRDVDPAT